MAGFTPMTLDQLVALEATDFASQPGVIPANTNEGSSLGPLFNAAALLGLFIQNLNLYLEQILRLATIPALPTGPNPDVDSFVNPFGVTRLGAAPASGNVTCSTPSPVSSTLVVPAGAGITTTSGVQFTIQPYGTGYSSSLGGYPITSGNSSVTVPVLCNVAGVLGNVIADTQFTPVGGAVGTPTITGISSITNASAFTNGVPVESDAALKARFTLEVSSGRVATANAIIAAVLGVQTGLIYSFGDQVNPDGSTHNAFFTFVVNEADTGATASTELIDAATAAINSVRSAGISFDCIGPTMVPVNVVATIVPVAGYSSAQVLPAVQAQYTTFVNSIGLNPGTTPTVCSLAAIYATLLRDTQINGVNVVDDVQGLTLNGSAADVTAAFANQLIAGTMNFTVT